MRIGELAELTALEPPTIRYYEAIGLLPAPARTAAGYRDYEAGVTSRLRFIKAARSIGLSLGEIGEVLRFRDRGEAPCQHVTALIERHAAELSEQIAALEDMRRDLERLAAKARKAPPVPTEAAFCQIIEG